MIVGYGAFLGSREHPGIVIVIIIGDMEVPKLSAPGDK
jgi:hypothetical protein